MRIACLLSGFLRGFQSCWPALVEKFGLAEHDVQVWLSTYDHMGWKPEERKGPVCWSAVVETYGPHLVFPAVDPWPPEGPLPSPEFAHFRKLKEQVRDFGQCAAADPFDLVVRTRPDLLVLDGFDLSRALDGALWVPKSHGPHERAWYSDHMGGLDDQMSIGVPETVFRAVQAIDLPGQEDKRWKRPHPETHWRRAVERSGVRLERFDCRHELVQPRKDGK